MNQSCNQQMFTLGNHLVLEHFCFWWVQLRFPNLLVFLPGFVSSFTKIADGLYHVFLITTVCIPGIGEYCVLFKRDQNYKDNRGYIYHTCIFVKSLKRAWQKWCWWTPQEKDHSIILYCGSRRLDKLNLHPMPNPTQGNLTEK